MASGKVISPSKNHLGAQVDLSAYTTTQYTFPTDGFLTANCLAVAQAKAIVRIYGASGESPSVSLGGWGNGGYPVWTTFVKAGMKCQVATLESNGKIVFFPLE